MLGFSLVGKAQTFSYNYIDPCTQDLKTLTFDQSTSVVVSYYGAIKSFTYDEISNGVFDAWINSTYLTYQTSSPCQGVLVTTTQTNQTILSTNIVNTVMNLNTITNLDFSGLGSTTDKATNLNINENKPTDKTNSNNTSSNDLNGNNNNTNNSSSDGQTSTSGNNSSNNTDNTGSNSSGSSSSSENKGVSGQGNGQGGGTKPDEKKQDETQTEQQKQEANNTTKTTSKSKTETQKPAILLTGDIVGIQKTDDGSNDARAMMSYTRVRGDGTASLGFSADFTVRAKIGNASLMRSWIGTNKAGHKHISLVSDQVSILDKSFTNTTMFIRVNSLKNFTALYGAAGTIGDLYNEQIISTLAIGGMMYKGKLSKSINTTAIMAVVWSPYTKYYTESFLESSPIIVPFLNIQYKLSKSFGVGMTFGGTYLAGEDILNYQILIGAKMII